MGDFWPGYGFQESSTRAEEAVGYTVSAAPDGQLKEDLFSPTANSTLRRSQFLAEGAHPHRSSSPSPVANESRIAHPRGVHVLPCFVCPSPLYSSSPSSRIHALHHSPREIICPLPC